VDVISLSHTFFHLSDSSNDQQFFHDDRSTISHLGRKIPAAGTQKDNNGSAITLLQKIARFCGIFASYFQSKLMRDSGMSGAHSGRADSRRDI